MLGKILSISFGVVVSGWSGLALSSSDPCNQGHWPQPMKRTVLTNGKEIITVKAGRSEYNLCNPHTISSTQKNNPDDSVSISTGQFDALKLCYMVVEELFYTPENIKEILKNERKCILQDTYRCT